MGLQVQAMHVYGSSIITSCTLYSVYILAMYQINPQNLQGAASTVSGKKRW